jgi:hypothetical protein
MTIGLVVVGSPAGAQQTADVLEQAVERARAAWLGHEVGDLLRSSDTVRLQVPGIPASAAMKPGQAGMLLQQHLKAAKEIGLDLVRIRRLAEDHAYAELARSYLVKGTSEELNERVFFGFRRLAGTWRLREVRITP